MLWSGIEALFAITTELRFRLATYVAATLEERGAKRTACYRRMKALYDFRSKLVHGGTVAENAIPEHIVEVRSILSQLSCKFTEAGSLHDEQAIERLLFG